MARKLSITTLFLAVCLVFSPKAVSEPDPTLLIKGVESTRLQIPPSKLHVHIVYKDALKVNVADVLVEFDGERRRFEKLSGSLDTRGYFDGAQVALFDGTEVTLRDIIDDSPDSMFDPRLLGLTTSYGWSDTLESTLPYRSAYKIELIGSEIMNGQLVWHVRMATHAPVTYQIDLWASSTNGFKVYKYDFSFATGHCTATSYYDNTNYLWLPNRVESQSFTADNQLRFEHTVTITDADADVMLPESNWTLAGLHLPIGTWISDRRTRLRELQWDGEKARKSVPVPPLDLKAPNVLKKRILIVSILGLFCVLPLFLLFKYLRS